MIPQQLPITLFGRKKELVVREGALGWRRDCLDDSISFGVLELVSVLGFHLNDSRNVIVYN